MQGDLYKITNNINGKVYIGKTYAGYLERWKRHKSDAFRENRKIDTKFYRALRKYGVNNFDVELLGTYESGKLEEMEIKYIKKFNSYYDGYNSTLGGDGNLQIEYNIEEIVALYNSGVSIKSIARELGIVNAGVISQIIKKNNNGCLSTKTKAVIVEQYDKDWNFLRKFNSKQDAYNWLVENYRGNMKRCTSYYRIKQSSENGGIAFGFHWKTIGEREVECNRNVSKKYLVSGYKNGKEVFKGETPANIARVLMKTGQAKSKSLGCVISSILSSNGNPKYGYTWNIKEIH